MRHAALIGGLVLAAAWVAVGQQSEPQVKTLEERVAALEGRVAQLQSDVLDLGIRLEANAFGLARREGAWRSLRRNMDGRQVQELIGKPIRNEIVYNMAGTAYSVGRYRDGAVYYHPRYVNKLIWWYHIYQQDFEEAIKKPPPPAMKPQEPEAG